MNIEKARATLALNLNKIIELIMKGESAATFM